MNQNSSLIRIQGQLILIPVTLRKISYLENSAMVPGPLNMLFLNQYNAGVYFILSEGQYVQFLIFLPVVNVE